MEILDLKILNLPNTNCREFVNKFRRFSKLSIPWNVCSL